LLCVAGEKLALANQDIEITKRSDQ
jgi:hypothetical protein